MAGNNPGKGPPPTRWNPETRADRSRKKEREKEARGHLPRHARDAGHRLNEGEQAAAAPVTEDGAPEAYVPDGFDLETVVCGCGRTVFAMCMVDVRGVPGPLRGEAEEVCDACWTGWVRKGKLSRAELARMQGAPDDVVRHIEENGHPHLP